MLSGEQDKELSNDIRVKIVAIGQRQRANAKRAGIWIRSDPWKLPECKTLAQVPWRERTSQLLGWIAVI